MIEPDRTEARRTLTWWLHDTISRARSPHALRHGRGWLGGGLEETLLALRGDLAPMPAAARDLLGPLRPRTYDAAARLLLWACHDGRGPQCRSYRSALYLVRRLEPEDLDGVGTAVART